MSDLRRTLAQSSTFIIAPGAQQDGESGPYLHSTDGASAAADQLLLGTVVDSKYRLLSVLGQGGMGTVYRAHHLALDKDVALKTFHTSELDREMRDRFLREARAIAKLENKQIVRVFDFGIADGDRPYYTMELLHGQSLAERLAGRNSLSTDEAVAIFYAVAEGLISAHSFGIVHRDLKPGNIFLELEGDRICGVKIVDFGIAKFSVGSDMLEQSQTATGMIFGSPLYMSPEQSLGLPVDKRSDIYSFGCAFYEALTGFPPFQGPSAIATIMAHQQQPVPPLNLFCPEKTFPLWLRTLVAKTLAKSKDHRISSFQEVLDVISYNLSVQSSHGPYDLLAAHADSAKTDSLLDQKNGGDFGASFFGKRALVVFISLTLFCLAAFSLLGKFNFGQPKSSSGPATAAAVVPLPATADVLAVRKVGRFFRGIESGPKGNVAVYNFGPTAIGYFGDQSNYHQFVCVGTVKLAAMDGWFYSPGEIMMLHPELFAGFQNNDIKNICFDSDVSVGSSWESKHIQAISHLTSLKGLIFARSLVDARAVPYLNKFSSLNLLDITESNLTGKDLSLLTGLKVLRTLLAARTLEMPVFLQDIADRGLPLQELLLKGCHLDDSAMLATGRIKSLRSLNLQETDVTNRGLEYLENLPALQKIYLGRTKVSSGMAKALVKIRTLKEIALPADSLSASDSVLFKKLLPACTVTEGHEGKKANAVVIFEGK